MGDEIEGLEFGKIARGCDLRDFEFGNYVVVVNGGIGGREAAKDGMLSFV